MRAGCAGLGVISEGYTDLAHCAVDAPIHVYKYILAPELLHDVVPGEKLTFSSDKEDEQFHRLPFQLHTPAVEG